MSGVFQHAPRRSVAAAAAVVAVVVAGGLLASCSGRPASSADKRSLVASIKPARILPAPAGLLAGGAPQPTGQMWLLADEAGAATLQELDVTTAKIGSILPEAASARAIAESSSGVVAVGLATADTGAVELRSGSSGALMATVPVGAPVKGLYAGADGSTLYVLNGTSASTSVSLLSLQTHQTSVSVPVPLGTVAIAVSPTSKDLFALTASGTVDVVNVGDGAVAARFPVGAKPVDLAVSNTGSTLYVLKHTGTGANVGTIDVATERETGAMPAPAQCAGIVVSPVGHSLYDMVGTAAYGNVQVFPLAA